MRPTVSQFFLPSRLYHESGQFPTWDMIYPVTRFTLASALPLSESVAIVRDLSGLQITFYFIQSSYHRSRIPLYVVYCMMLLVNTDLISARISAKKQRKKLLCHRFHVRATVLVIWKTTFHSFVGHCTPRRLGSSTNSPFVNLL